jgi:hypothetical protein
MTPAAWNLEGSVRPRRRTNRDHGGPSDGPWLAVLQGLTDNLATGNVLFRRGRIRRWDQLFFKRPF